MHPVLRCIPHRFDICILHETICFQTTAVIYAQRKLPNNTRIFQRRSCKNWPVFAGRWASYLLYPSFDPPTRQQSIWTPESMESRKLQEGAP